MIFTADDFHHDDVAKNVIFFMFCVLMFVFFSNLLISRFRKLTYLDVLMISIDNINSKCFVQSKFYFCFIRNDELLKSDENFSFKIN